MRGRPLVGRVVPVVALLGACADDVPLGPRQIEEQLAARTEIECGTYTNNTPADEDPPWFLCGPQPDVACMNEAIAGPKIAHLTYAFYDPATLLYRDHTYYAGDGKLVWIGFFQGPVVHNWYQSECKELVAEPYDVVEGESCWKVHATDCVRAGE
jgi:hypothetical protein